MTTEHPITPPPDKIHNWLQLEKVDYTLGQIITLAARWGADQELEACLKALDDAWDDPANFTVKELQHAVRATRRPKPQRLKEEALKALGPEPLPETGPTGGTILNKGSIERHRTIRRALEALPND